MINETVKQIADEARLVQLGNSWTYATGDQYDQRFCNLIVQKILEIVEQEIDLAYSQDQQWTAATLSALALDIIEQFGVELPDE